MITRRQALLSIMSATALAAAGLGAAPATAADDQLLADILVGVTDAVVRNYIREHWREGRWDGRRWLREGRYYTMAEYRDYLVRSAYPPPRRAAPAPRPTPAPPPAPHRPEPTPRSKGPVIERPPVPRPGPTPRPGYAPKPGYAPY